MQRLRIATKETYPKCLATLTLDGKSYSNLRIPYHPVFELAKTIELKPEPHLATLLSFLSGEIDEVNLADFEEIKKLAKRHFNVEIVSDGLDLARTLVSLLTSDKVTAQLLDSLHADTLCDAIEHAQTSDKYHEHDTEHIVGKYLEESKKGDYDKNKIKTVVKPRQQRYRPKDEGRAYDDERRNDHEDERIRKKSRNDDDGKDSKKKRYVEKKVQGSSDNVRTPAEFDVFREERQQKRKIKFENLTLDPPSERQESKKSPRPSSRGGNFRSRDEGNESERGPRDDRVSLAVSGDTDNGWRQRNRPTHIPVA